MYLLHIWPLRKTVLKPTYLDQCSKKQSIHPAQALHASTLGMKSSRQPLSILSLDVPSSTTNKENPKFFVEFTLGIVALFVARQRDKYASTGLAVFLGPSSLTVSTIVQEPLGVREKFILKDVLEGLQRD
jgi:hypothetical protein